MLFRVGRLAVNSQPTAGQHTTSSL